ncbi:isoprenylcysteine carboxylmethyltransferase family protein [Rhodoplanes sp. TEM]|uniref:Isoprenylcysteine carboxylmethyltransferase family protein n=1 Tax=Rhodoplanes tepidamans TaxID=200616 RepID=A0ABT5J920_RHOTP|nr:MULTISPECIES: isoprenylcysteine carboxylmethyltransferase family protein [Rhodoplanes]MDC7785555.1 isoprenylcysteine carboxylmethyltransferase family protein [Rhodoplanes tepidamans]MDC7985246.1 isoprenylcysteine carboxylmethyltransferase family protein [Rhodoplanes sp. TEM]MDQ0353275.1 protein-S-isoprenylcysteine O-methyltransferase Ste14 [Rhodoplanes tepidamans]
MADTGEVPTDGADKAGVIAPPPLIAAVTLAIAAGLEQAWPSGGAALLGLGPRLVAAAVLAAAGLVLAVAGERRFLRAGTDPLPWRPATALVTDGIYRYVRNPMYVGLGLLMLGLAVGFGSLWLLGLMLPTGLVLHYGVVLREERYLERKFGDRYRDFRARVPRYGWPPSRSPG